LDNFLKKVLLAFSLVSSFYIILYIIFDLLIWDTSSQYKKNIFSYIDSNNEYEHPYQTPEIKHKKDSPQEIVKTNKTLEKNLNQLALLESFNPKIKNDKNIKNIKNIKKVKKHKKSKKPKMVIIIDDIMFAYQVRLLKSIDLKITPSFLASIKTKKQARKLSKHFKSYMIHLPLEPNNDIPRERNTLNTNASLFTIEQVIKIAHNYFPNAHYINNHTGSKFTSNKQAMDKLAKALNIYKLKFLDSYTIATSIAKKSFDYKIYKRNVFLDNLDNKKYIKKQIKTAIKYAKRHNLAIVIGHPRKNTISALIQYQKILKKEVDVVFIDDL
jgi:polysaccharide deacetylase 2 family uncharacterized protein YibQ